MVRRLRGRFNAIVVLLLVDILIMIKRGVIGSMYDSVSSVEPFEKYFPLDLRLGSLIFVHLLDCCLARLQTLLPGWEALVVP